METKAAGVAKANEDGGFNEMVQRT